MIPNKHLGQHFLRCRWAVSTLIHAAKLEKADTVLEIGPGTGVLTRALARHAGRVIAVEKDERLATIINEVLKEEGITNVEIVTDDILKLLSRSKIWTNAYNKVVANIPYYLTSRLMRLLLENTPKRPELIVLTIQKEVARRIVAKPPHMNLLALSVQAFGTPTIIKKVPASCFSPKPKIDSAIIKISDISDGFFEKNRIDKTKFFELIRRAFSQKRKLLTSTTTVQPLMLDKLELSRDARPEELSLEQWAKVALYIDNL